MRHVHFQIQDDLKFPPNPAIRLEFNTRNSNMVLLKFLSKQLIKSQKADLLKDSSTVSHSYVRIFIIAPLANLLV